MMTAEAQQQTTKGSTTSNIGIYNQVFQISSIAVNNFMSTLDFILCLSFLK